MGGTRPLRVGIVTYDFVPFIGGQGRVTHDLWTRLRERDDIETYVVSPARNGLPGHHTHGSFARRFGKHLLFSVLASGAIGRWSRDLRADVLHLNSGPGGVLIPRRTDVPVICWPHHTYEQAVRLTPGQAWKRPFVAVERAAYARADLLACSTASVERVLRDRLALRPPVRVIPCGVDTGAFPALGRKRDPDLVVFVGRLDVRKNPALLLDAFALVTSERPSARLIVAGHGSLERRLRARVSELRIDARVTFERFVSHDRLVDLYNGAGLVVVPSLFEGFGLSAAEAQSTGACVVATNSEGLRDIVRDGETGVLVEPDAGAMARVLLALMEDTPRREGLGAAAAHRVRDEYAWPRIVAAWAAAYRDVAGGRA